MSIVHALRGTGVAIVTPFKGPDLDLDALDRVIEHVIAGDIDYIVALGSTGENALLSEQERRRVLDRLITTNAGRKPIVAGNFGSNNTREVCDYIRQFDFTGIDAVLSSNPSYVKPTQEGIYQHYIAIGECCPVPVVAYNVPGRTASNMEAQTTLRIASDCTNIIGVKEANSDMTQVSELIHGKPENFLVLSGDDPTALHTILAGGDGVISVIANAFPRQFSEMTRAALSGANDRAIELHNLLFDMHPHLYREGNPAGIKGALEIMNLANRDVRLPLTPLSAGGIDQLRHAMQYLM